MLALKISSPLVTESYVTSIPYPTTLRATTTIPAEADAAVDSDRLDGTMTDTTGTTPDAATDAMLVPKLQRPLFRELTLAC